jgi:hypothetical protein
MAVLSLAVDPPSCGAAGSIGASPSETGPPSRFHASGRLTISASFLPPLAGNIPFPVRVFHTDPEQSKYVDGSCIVPLSSAALIRHGVPRCTRLADAMSMPSGAPHDQSRHLFSLRVHQQDRHG